MEDLERLRSLIREMLEEDIVEFASVAGMGTGAGYIAPMKLSKKRRGKKAKTVNESKSVTGKPVGDYDFTFHNHFVYPVMDDSYHAEEHWYYYDGIECLAKSFGNAKNPFGENRNKGIKKSIRFLKGEIKYPHEA
jgi:hypothetical protein